MSVSQARAALLDVLTRVDEGEEVTITRHGRPVAVVVRPDRLRARRSSAAEQEADRLRLLLEKNRLSPSGATLSQARAEELVLHMRAERDSHG